MKRPPHKRRPTQADVARRADVSQALVSYVLNGKAELSVPEDTRQRILDAISELGYEPNFSARSLRTRKTFTIAVVLPDITNPFYPAFARGVQDVAQQRGYDLILYNTDGLPERERQCMRLLRRGQVDGVIMTLFHPNTEDLRSLQERGIELAMLSSLSRPELGIDSIGIDEPAAVCEAVAYLIGRGHRRIGILAGLPGTPPYLMRLDGYQRALIAAALPRDKQIIQNGDFSEQGGYVATHKLLTLDSRPTAIFAANDLMAIGALRALRAQGLRVPHDMALIGFDDIPAARLISPPLTTVTQFEGQLGRRLAELLLDRLESKLSEAARHEMLPHQLILRESA
jgi:LacI family transcriptional regulator